MKKIKLSTVTVYHTFISIISCFKLKWVLQGNCYKNCSKLFFFVEFQYKSILSHAYKRWEIASAIIFLFKVDYSFLMMSYHGLVIFKKWLRPLAFFNRNTIIHIMTTSVSQDRLYYV